MDNLLDDIQAFMETQGLSATAFGQLAMNDRHLVRQLQGKGKRPRRLWPETEQKVRRFMATYRAEQAA